MKFFALFILTMVFAVSCANPQNDQKAKAQAEVEALTKETENIHDEAMKEMADMNRLGRQLKDYMISATMTPEQAAKFTEALVAMEKAEADMMAWMTQYKEPQDKPADEAIRYLQEQKQKIETNRNDIRAALEAGKKLLPQ